jgi:methyl-accepting chemotaxis protein
MQILSRFKLRTKLTLLLGLSALAVVVSIGAAASLMQQRMFDDRVDKLRSVVQSTIGIAQSLENRVAAHTLTHEQALGLLRDDIHAMRFDGGAGYVTAWTTDGIVVAHGTVPALEGKPTPVADTSGRTVLQLARRRCRAATMALSVMLSQGPVSQRRSRRSLMPRCSLPGRWC